MTTERSPSPVPLRVLGTAAAGLAVVSSALAAVGVAQTLSTQGPGGAPQLGASALVALAALVPLLGWVWVARRNAGLLAPGRRFRFGPAAAVIAIAGPVSHLWWARPVLLEIATASAPPDRSAEAVRLVRSWWTCLIGGVGAVVLQPAVALLGHRGLVPYLPVWAELVLRAAPVLLLPAAAVHFAVLLRRIGHWQNGSTPAAGPVVAPADAGAVPPLGRGTAMACGLVTGSLLATGGSPPSSSWATYLLPAGRPGAQRAAAAYLITAAAVTAALVRLVLQPPAGSRMLATALCWAALLGLVSPALPRIPADWDVAGGLLLVVSALTGLVAADRVDRSSGVSRRTRSGAG